MPLPEFTNEAEFQEKWIRPLLSKLGYVLVNLAHGPGEQGKDFFFADFDRFEHRRFYAIQAKRGNIGAGQTDLDRLLNQVNRSFTVRLRFHKEADEKRVSAVYIMASGTISPKAKEYISDWCDQQRFGENVYYLDGDTLERLDKYVFRRVDVDLRNRLMGLFHECQHNTAIIAEIQRSFQAKGRVAVRCRHFALDQLLAFPPPEDILQVAQMEDSWNCLTTLNKMCDYHMTPIQIDSAEQWQHNAVLVNRTWEANLRLRDAAHEAINKLDQRYAIAVEVVE